MTTITPAQLPPHSSDFEAVVLGAIMLNAKVAMPVCSEMIREDFDVFFEQRHKTLYQLLIRMSEAGKPISDTTVVDQLLLDGQLNNCGGMAYVTELADRCASPYGVEYFIQQLLEYRTKRKLIMLGTEAAMDAKTAAPISDIIARTVQQLTDLSRSTRTATLSIRDLVLSAIETIETCHQSQGRPMGLPTGFTDLDKMTSGLRGGDMVVIAARPSMGKTSLAMNIAEHVAVDLKIPVGVFSLEMTAGSLVERMLCSRARVNLRSIRDGYMSERDFPKLTSAAGQISQAPLFIDDTPQLSVFNLATRAERMSEQHGIKLIVIDYLQLMRGGSQRKNDNRQTEVAEISGGIKAIAKKLNVPVIALSQLNRDMERDKNRRPRLSDLRESGAIEQDADVVGLLWKKGPSGKDQDEDDDGSAEAAPIALTIAKQRNGPTGDVHLTFLKSITRFENAARISEGDYQ